jgi:uncharacterized protein YndB with AHSA1/START domain
MPNDKYAGIGSDAVHAKTGRTWAEWIAALDKTGADQWPHKKIAEFVHKEFGCDGWWAQMVTVGYEQAKGLRVKHQTPAGFNASASKTIGVPIATLYKAWTDPKVREKWLVGAKKMVIRKATPNKSMRITWTDGTTHVAVGFFPKGAGKSQVAVEHSKLDGVKAVEMMKKCWKGALDKLESQLTNGAAKKPAATAVARTKRRSTTGRAR